MLTVSTEVHVTCVNYGKFWEGEYPFTACEFEWSDTYPRGTYMRSILNDLRRHGWEPGVTLDIWKCKTCREWEAK